MKNSLCIAILMAVCFTFFSNSKLAAQETAESGLVLVCFDPDACNYNGDIVILNDEPIPAGFGLEFCIYPQWYYPDTANGIFGKPILDCEPPQGYILANTACMEYVLQNDTFCYLVEWDYLCQEAYSECFELSLGCGDDTACNYDEDAIHPDDNEYCNYAAWYLPIDYVATAGTAIFSCSTPVDYFYANQCCVEYTIAIDAFCLETDWDAICEGYYNECLSTSLGCTNPADCNYEASACVDDGSCADVHGCTYKDACNYNYLATVDDESCTFPGCTDPSALNWDPFAECGGDGGILALGGLGGLGGPFGDPLCVYPMEEEECPGDFDGNGTVTAADLATFLGLFGTTCEPIIEL